MAWWRAPVGRLWRCRREGSKSSARDQDMTLEPHSIHITKDPSLILESIEALERRTEVVEELTKVLRRRACSWRTTIPTDRLVRPCRGSCCDDGGGGGGSTNLSMKAPKSSAMASRRAAERLGLGCTAAANGGPISKTAEYSKIMLLPYTAGSRVRNMQSETGKAYDETGQSIRFALNDFLYYKVAYHLEGVGGFTDNEVGDVADDVGCEAHVEEHEGYAEQHLADVGGMQVAVADRGKRGDGPDYKLKIGDVHSLHSWFTFIPPYTRALPPCDRSN
uniref:Uncharacterized protein n=1 Tax=Oryza rufipogon TaxID=4529 RepID=A0A0E0P4L7_ORYRU